MEPCSYQFQADKIEKMTQDLQTLQRYAGSLQIAWMLGAATGCIVSTAGMNLVFRNPKTGVVRECSLEEITSLEKLDASEIDIAKLGKEVPTDDLELYMRYQKEGSIEHFTDSEKKTISRIETMGITGDECEEILRARGREVNRPPIEEPEVVLPPRNETSYGKSSGNISELLENRPELTGTNREKLLSMVQDTKLAAYINEVYRPGASVGDGGTADKLIMEFYEGSSRHLPKAKERLVGINRIIDSGKLGLNDLDIAEALRDDLEYAIDLFK